MRRSFVRCFVTLALLAAPLGACDDNTATPLTPTPPAPTTETFAGTLSVNGAVTFPFVTASAGSVTATLKTLEPDATVIIGLALGTWNGTACDALSGPPCALDHGVGILVGGVCLPTRCDAGFYLQGTDCVCEPEIYCPAAKLYVASWSGWCADPSHEAATGE